MRFLFFLLLLFTTFTSQSQTSTKQRFTYEHPQMGTLFRIVLYADSEIKARAASAAAFNRIDALNKILSDYDPDSELNRLAAMACSGKEVKLSPDLWYILNKSLQVSEKTNGAFDVTIGPVIQLWRRARRQHELPSEGALAQAKRLTGFHNVILNPQAKTAQLRVEGMQLDMGAIGKGYAVDEAMQVLKAYGIKSALVDGGGNIVVSKAPPKSKGWVIDLEPLPISYGQGQQKVFLKHQGMASSGDLYQFVEVNGVRYSHIVDPFTGIGLTDQSRVTIITKNATDADWLSTALSVLPPAAGFALIERMPRSAASIIKNKNNTPEVWKSKRYKRLFKSK